MDTPPAIPPVITQEIRIVDAQGHVRLLLSAVSGTPVIVLMRPDGSPGARLSLAADGHPAITLSNPDTAGPTASLEVDDKGAHVKFDGPARSSSYLFLNNAGTSGLVLMDTHGTRRWSAIVTPQGGAKIESFGADGKPPSVPSR